MRFLKVSDDDLMRFLGVESYERPCLPTTATTTTTTTTTTVTTSFVRENMEAFLMHSVWSESF